MKLLYANGCSNTFGFELGEELFQNDYAERGIINIFHKNPSKQPNFFIPEHIEYMKNNSYAKIFSNYLNVENYQNDSLVGSSNERILYVTYNSILNLLKKYKSNDIFVLIGFTEETRHLMYSSHSNDYSDYHLRYADPNFFLKNNIPKEELDRRIKNRTLDKFVTEILSNKFKLALVNPIQYTIKFLKNVLDMKNFLITNGIENFMLCSTLHHNLYMYYPTRFALKNDSIFPEFGILQNFINNIKKDRRILITTNEIDNDMFNRNNWVDMIYFIEKNNLKLCKLNHPDIESHQAWAKYLFDYYSGASTQN